MLIWCWCSVYPWRHELFRRWRLTFVAPRRDGDCEIFQFCLGFSCPTLSLKHYAWTTENNKNTSPWTNPFSIKQQKHILSVSYQYHISIIVHQKPHHATRDIWPLKFHPAGAAVTAEAGESLRSRRQGHAARGEGTRRGHWHRALAELQKIGSKHSEEQRRIETKIYIFLYICLLLYHNNSNNII